MSADAVRIELRGPAVVVTICRPERRNALSVAVVEGLERALATLDPGRSRCVVLAGEGGQAFCAGADLKERAQMSPEEARAFVDRLRALMDRVATCDLPVVAALSGVALGGGLELALACDIRVADATASLGLPEVRLAIVPGAGGTQRLPRVVGAARARELILTGRRVGADEALRIGLVHRVAEDGTSLELALAVADEIALAGPVAIRAARRALDEGEGVPLRDALAAERDAYELVLGTHDRLEALAAFAEKRPPRFEGR
jgi:methylglutaconyl-CoA hydratase